MTIGIFLLLILFLSFFALSFCLKQILPFSTVHLITRIYCWLMLAVMIFYAIKIEKQKFLLYEEQKYPFGKALLMFLSLGVIIFFGEIVIVLIPMLFGFSEEISQATKINLSVLKGNYLLAIFTCITAGVTEELLVRGYLQTRLEKLFNNAWVGIFISSFFFGLMHTSWGSILHIVATFWAGLVYAFFYYKYRNIKILIFVHMFHDLILISLQLFHDNIIHTGLAF